MFCPYCGKQLCNEAKFCGFCGGQIGSARRAGDFGEKKDGNGGSRTAGRDAKMDSPGKKAAAAASSIPVRLIGVITATAVVIAVVVIVVAVLFSGGIGVAGGNSSATDSGSDEIDSFSLPGNMSELMTTLSAASVGDSVYFGTYEQDGNLENGEEEIEWIVLDARNNCLLLVSAKILDEVPYVESASNFTWEGSYIRSWCNTDFYQVAFDEAEQSLICTTTVCTLRDDYWNSYNGKNTEDKVFILSSDEYYEYQPNYHDRQAGITVYGNKSGNTGSRWYWLRCNSISYEARYMNAGLALYGSEAYATNGSYDFVGVRPAIWVSTTGEMPDQIIMGDDDSARMTEIGDLIYCGDLQWIILDIKDDQLLLLTRYVLDDELEFDDNDGDAWDTSTIRTWLNSDFFDEYGIDVETQSAIMMTTVVTDGCSDTLDQVFLLSEKEAELYLDTNSSREATDDYGHDAEWMLRSTENGRVQFVTEGGRVTNHDVHADPQARPAMWLRDETLLTWYVADGDGEIIGVGASNTLSPMQ